MEYLQINKTVNKTKKYTIYDIKANNIFDKNVYLFIYIETFLWLIK